MYGIALSRLQNICKKYFLLAYLARELFNLWIMFKIMIDNKETNENIWKNFDINCNK